MRPSLHLLLLLALPCAAAQFDAYVDTLYDVDVPVVSRSISFENPTGAKGQGGMAASALGVGRKGAPCRFIAPGETVQLCDIAGRGVIRHIWMTTGGEQNNLLGLVVRAWWDDQPHPSIEAPLGNFFGVTFGLARGQSYQSAVHSANMGQGVGIQAAGMDIYLPMPFTTRARMTISNDSSNALPLYYSIDYTLGDPVPQNVGRLHVLYRRENLTTLTRDFEILSRSNCHGRFIGCMLGIRAIGPGWWGEGEFKVYLDGDTNFPTICGTGSEDYIGQSWGLQHEQHLYAGTSYLKGNFQAIYRWHLRDPLYWQKDIRATIQQIGIRNTPAGGLELWERSDDVCTTTFWYEPVPSAPLPPLPGLTERIKDLAEPQ
jgi:hypothetical protein